MRDIEVKNNIKLKKLVIIEEDREEFKKLQEFIELLQRVDRTFCFEALLELFEFVISPSDKLVNGAIYTPDDIRQYITQETFQKYSDDIYSCKVADISCGCGGFLIDATRLIKEKTNKSYKEIYRDNIFGVDIQEYSIERTKILLSLLAIEDGEDETKFEFNLYTRDSLDFEWKQENDVINKNGGFDIIIGNPPYVCSRNMDEKTKQLMQKWSSCKSGHPDLYIPFFQIGCDLLKYNGVLGYITVNSFINSVNGRAIRKYFEDKKVKLHIIDFGDEQIFNARLTYTCICFIQRIKSDIIYYSREKRNQLSKYINFKELYYKDLNVHEGWSLKDNELVKKLESSGTPFGTIYDTKSGIATLKNNIYIFKPVGEDSKYYYLNQEILIEKGLCKDIINSNKLVRDENLEKIKEKIIFPYTHDENNQAVLIEEKILQEKYPKAYEYLLQQKDILSTRDKGKGNYPAWYAFGRSQSLEKQKYKLFFPQLVKKGFITVLNEDEDLYFYNGMCAYASREKLIQLQKIMATDIFWQYVENKTKHYASGYYGLGRNYLKNFGINFLSKWDF